MKFEPLNPAAWGTTATTNVISLVLVVVTGIYVILTWRIASANKGMLDNIREQYRDSLRPIVLPTLQVRDQIVVRLAISNSGKSPAYGFRARIDKDFLQWGDGKNIRDFSIFNKEIPVLAPGGEIIVDLAQGFNLDRVEGGKIVTPLEFTVSLSYASRDRQLFEDVVAIDLSPYLQTHTPKTLAESLTLIERHLKKLSDTPGAISEALDRIEQRQLSKQD